MTKAKVATNDSQPPKANISLTKVIVSTVIVIAILLLVFVWFLPQLIDYDQVIEAIKKLTSAQIIALLLLGILRVINEGWAYVPTLRGLKLWQGTLAYNTSTAWSNVIPIPLDMPIRWRMYYTWGFETGKIIISFPLSGVFTIFVKLAMPVLALGGIILLGDEQSWMIWAALIGLVSLVVLVVVVYKIVKSKKFTTKLAGWTKNIVDWSLSKINKSVDVDFESKALELREAALDVLGNRWFEELMATFSAQMLQAFILFVSLYFVGIPTDVLSIVDVLLVYSIAQLFLIIPITPGGMGVAEAAYITMLTAIAGNEWSNAIAAGVFVFRLVTWLLVVPLGGISYFGWRWTLRKPKYKQLNRA